MAAFKPRVPAPVLVKVAAVPVIVPALVPPLTVSAVAAPRLTVPPDRVEIALVAPFKFTVPPESVPIEAVLAKVVLPAPPRLPRVTVPVAAEK